MNGVSIRYGAAIEVCHQPKWKLLAAVVNNTDHLTTVHYSNGNTQTLSAELIPNKIYDNWCFRVVFIQNQYKCDGGLH